MYGPENPQFGSIQIYNAVNGHVQTGFEEIATRAGIAMNCPENVRPLEFWIHCLCQDLRSRNSPELFARSKEGGIVIAVVASSASYCLRLATAAQEDEHRARLLKDDGNTLQGSQRLAMTNTTADNPADLLLKVEKSRKYLDARELRVLTMVSEIIEATQKCRRHANSDEDAAKAVMHCLLGIPGEGDGLQGLAGADLDAFATALTQETNASVSAISDTLNKHVDLLLEWIQVWVWNPAIRGLNKAISPDSEAWEDFAGWVRRQAWEVLDAARRLKAHLEKASANAFTRGSELPSTPYSGSPDNQPAIPERGPVGRSSDIRIPSGVGDAQTSRDDGGSAEKFLYERLSPDDPNYSLIKASDLKSWGDSYALLAKGYGGDLSLKDWIDGCVSTVADGFDTQVRVHDTTELSALCKELDSLTEASIDRVRRALAPEVERLGLDGIDEAITDFSEQIRTRCAAAKSTILKRELGQEGDLAVTLRKDSRPPHKLPALSKRDLLVHDAIGRDRFGILTNADILLDRSVRRKLRNEFHLKTPDSVKACLDRIRKGKGYPLSGEIKIKRSER